MIFKYLKQITHCLFAILVILLLSNCQSDEQRFAAHMEKASLYIAEEKLVEAVLELKNAVKIEPLSDTAYLTLGVTYLKLHEIDLAAQSFTSAIKSNQDNLQAHLNLGQILVMVGKPMGGRLAAKAILDREPDHIEGLQLLAIVKYHENNLAGAIKTLQKVSELAPQRIETRLFLAKLLSSYGNIQAAEREYLQAISVDSTDPLPYVKLANLYAKQAEWPKIMDVLDQMPPLNSKALTDLAELADFCEKNRQTAVAGQIFIKGTASATHGDARPLAYLADYYARQGAYPRALEVMRQAHVLEPEHPTILATIGSLHMDLNNTEAAEDFTDRTLALDSTNAVANYTKGRLYLLKNEFANALQMFEHSLKRAPDNALAHYYIAICLMNRGAHGLSESDLFRAAAGYLENEDAWIQKMTINELQKALTLEPRLLNARLVLARIFLVTKNIEKARAQIEKALALNPQHLKTLTLQGSLKIMEKDFAGAETICRKVLSQEPRNGLWHSRAGLVYALMGRMSDALVAYELALEYNPLQLDALKSIIQIHIRTGRHQEALDACIKHKKLLNNNHDALAIVAYLEGRIYLSIKAPDMAVPRFQKAIALAPKSIAPRMALAKVYFHGNQMDLAAVQCQDILKVNPQNIPACMMLGNLYYLQEEKQKAATYYRRALAIDSGHGPAANNLAYILSENDNQLREALRLIKIAESKMPRDPRVKDTLGWLYYKIGNYTDAIAQLKKSLTLAPDSAITHYHLGLAYYQGGDYMKSREHIRKALSLDPDFEEAEKARAMLID